MNLVRTAQALEQISRQAARSRLLRAEALTGSAEQTLRSTAQTRQVFGQALAMIPVPDAVQALTNLIAAQDHIDQAVRTYPRRLSFISQVRDLRLRQVISQLSGLIQSAQGSAAPRIELTTASFGQMLDDLVVARILISRIATALLQP